jgi:hypothetical protein
VLLVFCHLGIQVLLQPFRHQLLYLVLVALLLEI